VSGVVGLFGGSFDPIHHGHLLVAQAAAEVLGLDEIRFVPAREQPFKAGEHVAPAADRASMVERAIAGSVGMRLERLELDRPGPSYTVDTLRALRGREPGASFVLLVGSDAAMGVPRWHEAPELSRLARVVAFGRAGIASGTLPPGIEFITVPAVEISSTVVRERVRRGQSIRYWVPDAVAEFIASRGLYRDGAG
jgi:nicotinate-nucleotide adenylyltransferase